MTSTTAPGARTTVYVTTASGGLGEIFVDGDVAVLQCDWADGAGVGTAAELAERIGLRAGLPVSAAVPDRNREAAFTESEPASSTRTTRLATWDTLPRPRPAAWAKSGPWSLRNVCP